MKFLDHGGSPVLTIAHLFKKRKQNLADGTATARPGGPAEAAGKLPPDPLLAGSPAPATRLG